MITTIDPCRFGTFMITFIKRIREVEFHNEIIAAQDKESYCKNSKFMRRGQTKLTAAYGAFICSSAHCIV
jgi:hypothetical protein